MEAYNYMYLTLEILYSCIQKYTIYTNLYTSVTNVTHCMIIYRKGNAHFPQQLLVL